MSDLAPPKGQVAVERLRRRLETLRKHHDECLPRFEQSADGINDGQKQDTLKLRQRYMESRAKKSNKKSDKKQDSSSMVR